MSNRTGSVGALLANVCLAAAFLAGCAVSAGGDQLAGKRLPPPPADHVAVLTHPDRPAEDFKQDAARKPSDVLKFTGVEYGMTLVELDAEGGYYTCLLYTSPSPRDGLLSRMPSSA